MWQYAIDHLKDAAEVTVSSPTYNTPQKMVESIIDSAPPYFALAGHSMGGWLCQEVMRRAPERVMKLCLMNTTARCDTEEKKRSRQNMIKRVMDGEFEQVSQELSEKFVMNSQLRGEMIKMFHEVGKEAFICQEQSMLERSETESVLKEIHCPTLIIHAAQDQVFSYEEHIEMAEKISGSKVAVVEDSGHMSPMEQPQAVTALLRFWLEWMEEPERTPGLQNVHAGRCSKD